jgi:hypothetical protein
MFPHRSQEEQGQSATGRLGSTDLVKIERVTASPEGEGKDRAGLELSEAERWILGALEAGESTLHSPGGKKRRKEGKGC